MKLYRLALASTLTLLPLLAAACGSDDDTPPNNNTTGGNNSVGGSGGSNVNPTGGAGGTNTNPTGGSGGSGGSNVNPGGCDLSGEGLSREEIPEPAAGSTVTLTNDRVWELKGVVNVVEGATLEIEPCTRIEGDGATLGTLVIQRGGKILAPGEADKPILFTSALPEGSRAPGDWGGVIILGKAPNYKSSGSSHPSIEGLDPGEGLYGGDDDDDSSGILTYARIEYSGVEIGDGNEINGLTMGSVGRGTVIHHVMVSNTLDDCFEWFGGTVDAQYLICNNGGDDMFDTDHGYRGSLQFLFGRQLNVLSDDPNGWECDSDKGGAQPNTFVTASNVTLCGLGTDPANPQYGAVFRENLEGDFRNMILTGFESSFDVRDDAGTETSPKVKLTHTLVKGVTEDIAYAESGATDNDNGFDERAWFNAGTGNGILSSAIDCGTSGNAPKPFPASALSGGAPAASSVDGVPTQFDTSANFIGAFRDASDNWMTGLWVNWAAN